MAAKVLFSADHHLSHANIIKYCSRPFKDVDHMNETIINNYNAKADENTIGYFLGDFCFGRADLKMIKSFAERFLGKKYLILGNHDKKLRSLLRTTSVLSMSGFQEVVKAEDVKYTFDDGESKEFMCYHYPQVTWNKRRYGAVHLFGHVHNLIRNPIPGSLDVGVDACDFSPLSPEDIRVKLRALNQWVDSSNEL